MHIPPGRKLGDLWTLNDKPPNQGVVKGGQVRAASRLLPWNLSKAPNGRARTAGTARTWWGFFESHLEEQQEPMSPSPLSGSDGVLPTPSGDGGSLSWQTEPEQDALWGTRCFVRWPTAHREREGWVQSMEMQGHLLGRYGEIDPHSITSVN